MSLMYQVVNDLTYSSIDYIDIEKYTRKIHKINDLVINPGENKKQHIHGNSFLFSLNDWQYGHVMQECIGHYEFLKKYIPDLQLVFTYSSDNAQLETLEPKIFKDILDLYGANFDSVILLKNAETSFDSIYYLYNFFMFDLEKFLPTNKPVHNEDDPDFHHQLELAQLVKNKFEPYLKDDNQHKIFISRKEADKGYKHKKELKEKIDLGIATQQEIKYYNRYVSVGGEQQTLDTINTRLFTDSEILEKFFIKLGYKVIDNENYNLFEQINNYYNATHVASIDGTGCYNAIFCKPGTIVAILNTNNRFYWFFNRLIKHVATKYVFRFPVRKINDVGYVPVDEIITKLTERIRIL